MEGKTRDHTNLRSLSDPHGVCRNKPQGSERRGRHKSREEVTMLIDEDSDHGDVVVTVMVIMVVVMVYT